MAVTLYKALHPEDCNVTEDEIADVTIKHVLVDADYNDLGVSVGNRFSKVYNEQRKLHGNTKRAVTETIRICKDMNVLKEYLESKEQEVVDIMMTQRNDYRKTDIESRFYNRLSIE